MTKYNSTMYLSGGGDAELTKEIDKYFLQEFPVKNILYIPVAMERDALGYEACYDWIVDAMSKLSDDFVHISMALDLKNAPNLENFSAVYIGGGNTYKLLNEVYETGFNTILKSYLNNGGVVYGGSAGAIILGKNIDTVIKENPLYRYTHTEGLSLIGDYSIICHYTEQENKNILEYIKKHNNPVIAIPEGVGLIVKNNEILVVGYRPITIFKKDGSSESIESGKTISII